MNKPQTGNTTAEHVKVAGELADKARAEIAARDAAPSEQSETLLMMQGNRTLGCLKNDGGRGPHDFTDFSPMGVLVCRHCCLPESIFPVLDGTRDDAGRVVDNSEDEPTTPFDLVSAAKEISSLITYEPQSSYCLRKEYNAITRLSKQFDEFATVYDPECELPQLAGHVHGIIGGLVQENSALRSQVAALTEERNESQKLSNDLRERVWALENFNICKTNDLTTAQATIAKLRLRLLSAAGDDLCRLSQEEIKELSSGAVKIPPKGEFLASCERFHEQLAAGPGVLNNCLTLAQLIAENETLLRRAEAAEKQVATLERQLVEASAECAALRELATKLIEDVDTLEFYYYDKTAYSRWLDMQHTGMGNGPVVIKPGIGSDLLERLTAANATIATLKKERADEEDAHGATLFSLDEAKQQVATLSKRAENISGDEARELQDILRTLTDSGTALKTSARELVAQWENKQKRIDDLELQAAILLDQLTAAQEQVAALTEERNESQKLSNDLRERVWALENFNICKTNDLTTAQATIAELERQLRVEKSDHSDFLAFMASEFAKWPCIHEDGHHHATPPMMWPELIGCIVQKAKADSQVIIAELQAEVARLTPKVIVGDGHPDLPAGHAIAGRMSDGRVNVWLCNADCVGQRGAVYIDYGIPEFPQAKDNTR